MLRRRPNTVGSLLTLLFTLVITAFAQAQVDLQDISDPPRPPRQDRAIKMLPSLLEASRIARDADHGGVDAADAKLVLLGADVADGEYARVEIVGRQPANAEIATAVAGHNGAVVRTAGNRVEARVPVAELEALSRSLPATYHIVPLGFGQQVLDFEGQGPTIMRDGDYRDAGYDGSGITIAVIDIGYQGLSSSVQTGDAPAGYVPVNLTSTSFQSSQSGNHGRFVAETIYDHAPGADYILFKVSGQTSAADAIAQAASMGADVISMSLGWFPDDWDDETSAISQAASAAASQGILVFNSAGNSADKHYQGEFTDPDGDDFHSWDGGIDEALRCTVQPGGSLSFTLIWDRSGGSHDYDLFLYNQDATGLFAWSAQVGDAYEGASWTNNSPFVQTVQVVVERRSGPGTTIELFASKTTVMNEHVEAFSSVLCPSDATHPSVISVGAAEQNMYGAAKWSPGVSAVYSSHGPTNGGQTVPDICAPTSTSVSWAGSFTGTSCACPHAAGLTAALWSADPSVPAFQIRELMYEYAREKDWGAVGFDNIYGRGGVNLPPYADCNFNDNPDAFDIVAGIVDDDNDNGEPDECEPSGYLFGLLGPDVPPLIDFIMVATIDPSPSPTVPLGQVSGFDMVFSFDPTIIQIDSVEPAPGLLELLGDMPAEFTTQVEGGALGVRCNFGFDPATGNPIALAIGEHREIVVVGCSFVPGASASGTPTIDFRFEDQPSGTALILPAVQGIREYSATGGTVTQYPARLGSLTTATVELVDHLFEVTPGNNSSAQLEGGITIAYEPPSASTTEFSIRWTARRLYADPAPATGASMVVRFEDMLISSLGAEPTAAVAELEPEFFAVDVQGDAIAIDVVWSPAGAGGEAVDFGTSGLEIADLKFETVSDAFLDADDALSTTIDFEESPLMPFAQNRVYGVGFDETPLLASGQLHFVPIETPESDFRRGDVDSSGSVSIADAIQLLDHLFAGAPAPQCADGADANDDGTLSIADPIFLLDYMFNLGVAPPAPGPVSCGADPTADALDCNTTGC